MSIFSFFRSQFIDVIEWLDRTQDTLVFRFDRHNNEIKNGAKLIVREGQVAAFVNEGTIADVFSPGTYELKTANLPVLSSLQSWSHGFESPFKAEVYFLSTRIFTDMKWGTRNPIMLRDPEFGPVRLRAFGSYSFRVEDAAIFIRELSGTKGEFTADLISDQLRNLIVSGIPRVIAESQVAALDLSSNYEKLGDFLQERLQPDFDVYGLELSQLLVENISFPEAVEKALDQRTSMGIVGDLDKYMQFQAGSTLGQGGSGSSAIEAGLGMAYGQKLASQVQSPSSDHRQSQEKKSAESSASSAHPPAFTAPKAEEAKYFLYQNGVQTGPFTATHLHQLIQSSRLQEEDFLWNHGLTNWIQVQQHPDFKHLFKLAPPPFSKG